VNPTEAIERIWYGTGEGGLLPAILRAASWPYRAGFAAREALYRSGFRKMKRLPVPCVAVGNLVVGGAGKTPTASWLTSFFRKEGLRPAVISRGYGGVRRGPERVTVGEGAESAGLYGDEPVMLARRHPDVPVVVARDRWAAGMDAAVTWKAQVVVADDAFQHRRLERDLDIVVVDATRFFGNGRLFPAGPLREHPRGLRRADVVLITRGSEAEALEERRAQLSLLAPGTLFVEGEIVPSRWRSFENQGDGEDPPSGPLYAFCGLANPETFRSTLTGMNRELAGWRPFPDHYRYRDADLEEVVRRARASGAVAAVTTEKDAVRIPRWAGEPPLFVLDVGLEIHRGRKALEARLRSLGRGGVE